MRTRKLTDFIPEYKEGAAKISDNVPAAVEPLPELKTGDILRHKNGALYRVYRVNNPKTGLYIEPRYRLEKIDTIRIKGHNEFSLDELQNAGMILELEGEGGNEKRKSQYSDVRRS